MRAATGRRRFLLLTGTVAEHRSDNRPATSRRSKGGELVLKLYVSTPALDASEADGLRRGEEGQTMAEYGVVLAVITAAVVASISLLSGSVRGAIENVIGILPG
jgi:Flp pilus assembly pilin Flp